MSCNTVKLFLWGLASAASVSLGANSLWAAEREKGESAFPGTRIERVNQYIEEWAREKGTVQSIEKYFEAIREIIKCPACNSLGGEGPIWSSGLYYHSCLKRDEGQGKGSSGDGSENSGYSGATVLESPGNGGMPAQIIKTFKDADKGLRELAYSLMAFQMHKHHDELKMVAIDDAFLCPGALSFVMERALGNDIHYFMQRDDRYDVIRACARYLGIFHIKQLKHQAETEEIEVQGTKYLAHAASFFNTLSENLTQSRKGVTLFRLDIRAQRNDLDEFKSSDIIGILPEEEKERCIRFIKRTQELFEKCSGYVYRALKPNGVETERPYWTTITHGDAHRRNFFYNGDEALDVTKDSLRRVTMIDYSSIMETYGNIGDPAQDIGRFLGSLWDWASENPLESEEDTYELIRCLQEAALECYIDTVTKRSAKEEGEKGKEESSREEQYQTSLDDVFRHIFTENCNFYKLRYYRAIFNSSKNRKTNESKERLLRYWMREMERPESEFATRLLEPEKYVRKRQHRNWTRIAKTEEVIHNLQEKLTVFIESAPEGSPSYLTRLWRQVHDAGSATLIGMGGMGKTSLALEYAHESLENGAYNLIWWLCSEQPEVFLRQGYEDILLKTRGSADVTALRKIETFEEQGAIMDIVKQVTTPGMNEGKIAFIIEALEKIEASERQEVIEMAKQFITNGMLMDGEEIPFIINSVQYLKKEKDPIKRLKILIELYSHCRPPEHRWLLIYDNARNLENLGGLIPQHKNIHVLITSRNQGWENAFNLEAFYPEDSVRYLLAKTGLDSSIDKDKESLARKVAEKLGHLPVALSLAANYVKLIGGEAVSTSLFEEFLEGFEKDPSASRNPLKDQEPYDLLVGKTYDMLEEELGRELEEGGEGLSAEEVGEYAKNMMVRWAYLNPDEISRNFFMEFEDNKKKTEKAVEKLCNLSLLKEIGNSSFSVHRLVQKIIRNKDIRNQGISTFLDVSRRIETLFHEYVADDEKFANILTFLPHVMTLLEHSETDHLNLPWEQAHSLRWIGRVLHTWYGKTGIYEQERSEGRGTDEDLFLEEKRDFREVYFLGIKEDEDANTWIDGKDIHPRIYNTLGWMHAKGYYGLEKKDLNERIDQVFGYLKTSSGKGDLNGPLYMGIIYRSDKNDVQAENWFRIAADRGNFLAMHCLGKLYQDRKDYELAKGWYEKAADEGKNPNAMNNLGYLYQHGLLDEKKPNYHKAMEWYEKAAVLRNAPAMYNIGWLYEHGDEHKGVKQDYQKAMGWYKKAVDLGYSPAMANIGGLYAYGCLGAPDYQKAMIWSKRAAELGSAGAMNNIGWLYQKGLLAGKPNYGEALEEALGWFKKAANLGNVDSIEAIKKIGTQYQKGQEIPCNLNKARECFEITANLGDTEAMNELAWFYEKGKGGAKKDKKQAKLWRDKAKQAGYKG